MFQIIITLNNKCTTEKTVKEFSLGEGGLVHWTGMQPDVGEVAHLRFE